jgi:putative tryptophan/tyrosine transport system substrate-binding protein
MLDLTRRNVITLIGAAAGASVARPLAARAQQDGRIRRIAMATGISDEAGTRARYTAFFAELARLGWVDGRNLRIDYRWGDGNASNIRKNAAELAALAPDVIVATGGATLGLLLEHTRTIPIVFTLVPDPVGAGFVESLSRPGGNATGFEQFEYGVSGKWVELLKEIAPGVKRAAILWDPKIPAGIGQFAIIQSVAPSFGTDVIPIKPRDPSELDRTIATFASTGNGGLIVTSYPEAVVQRDLIAAAALRHKLPAVYSTRDFVISGGLASYSADFIDQFRRAAGYVDRILKGEKPAELPVQKPNKYELVLNLRTAKAIGIALSPSLLARADEVIE